MRAYFVVALIFSTSTTALASDWRVAVIDNESQMGVSISFIDLETIERSGDEVRFEMDVRFGRPPGRWDGFRARIRAGCQTRRWETEGVALYRGDERMGEAVPVPEQDAAPDSNAYQVIEAVCAGHYHTGTVDPTLHARSVFEGR